MAWLYAANRCLIPGLRLLIPGTTRGAEYIPQQGPALIAANHGSFVDPWLIALRAPKRSYRYLITEQWFHRSALWRSLFRAWGTIPTTPTDPEKALERVVQTLRDGQAVVLFPEGRVSRDGSVGRGKRGIARIAARSGIPVIPLGLEGNHEFLPRTNRWPTWHPVNARVGPPIPFPEESQQDIDSLNRFTEQVMAEIRRLAGQPESLSAR